MTRQVTTPDDHGREARNAREMPDPDALRCPGSGFQYGAVCLSRLPCADHGVTDEARAVELYGCVYEQREGEIVLHIEARSGRPVAHTEKGERR